MTAKLNRETQTFRIIKRMIEDPTSSEMELLADYPNFSVKKFDRMLADHNISRSAGFWVFPDYLPRQVRAVEGIAEPVYVGCIVEPRRINVMSAAPIARCLVSEALERNRHRLRVGGK